MDSSWFSLARAERACNCLTFRRGQRARWDSSGKDCVWSPAGSWIASVRTGSCNDTTNSYRREEVWLLPAKEGTPRRVVRGGYPRWSTNGQTLFVHSRMTSQILAVNMADLDAPPTVLYDKTPGWYYTVSPDEKQVAFGLSGRLKIRDRPTGAITGKWPTPGERGLLPAWSPDGALIAFGGFNGAKLGLWVLQVQTGRAVPVKTGLFTMPAWSADGRWLAFDERVGKSNSVWLVGRPHLDQLFSGR
jgi:Tol biopolymer transport system component